MGALGGMVGFGLVAGSLVCSGMVARARWGEQPVSGPVVTGTAQVLAAHERRFVGGFDLMFGSDSDTHLYKIQLKVKVRGRESCQITRDCWINTRRGPVVGMHYPIKVSADDPNRLQVEWNKPWDPTIPRTR